MYVLLKRIQVSSAGTDKSLNRLFDYEDYANFETRSNTIAHKFKDLDSKKLLMAVEDLVDSERTPLPAKKTYSAGSTFKDKIGIVR